MSAGSTPRERIPLADHVADAVALLAAVRRTDRIALGPEAVGRVAATGRRAAVDVPGHDNSQMDGYAVAVADLAPGRAGPGGDAARHTDGAGRTDEALQTGGTHTPGSTVTLPLGPTIAAGDRPGRHLPGTAAPIMTGAPIPCGADAVIPVEESAEGSFGGQHPADAASRMSHQADADPPAADPATVTLHPAATEPGRFVRRRGSDTHGGDAVLREGQLLTPARIAHLAACGVTDVEVHGPVRAIVLSTGSEVRTGIGTADDPAPLPDGDTFDANGPGLAAALIDAGAEVVHVGSVPDDADVLLQTLRDLVDRTGAELIVTSGGVSMGAFEVVRQAADHDGVSLTFTSVAMQPGGPQGIGTLDLPGHDHRPGARIPWLAFPGNPVSALLSCELIARPALGAPERTRLRLPVQSEAEETSPPALAQYRRARVLPSGQVRLVGGPSSHLIGGLAQADALVVVPVGTDLLRDGDTVETILLPRGER